MTTTNEHARGHDRHDPVAVLDAEHEVIRRLLDAVEGMAAAIDAGVTLPRGDIDDALATIRGFADRCHHAKEEIVLFPALRAAAPEVAPRIVRGLEGDHEAGRRLVRLLATDADATARGDSHASARFARHARLYSRLVEGHIRIETEELLPLAERALTPARLAFVAERFADIEREEAGTGAHERFEAVIDRLAASYGS